MWLIYLPEQILKLIGIGHIIFFCIKKQDAIASCFFFYLGDITILKLILNCFAIYISNVLINLLSYFYNRLKEKRIIRFT